MSGVLRIWGLLVRHRAGRLGSVPAAARDRWLGRLPSVLAVIAFAAATWAALAVAAGTYAFTERALSAAALATLPPDARQSAGQYPVLALISCVLLVVPVTTLGAAAARLTVARRNIRLARLRLVGASTAQVGVLALLDAALEAAVGSAAGVVVWLLSLPALAGVQFQGRPFAVAELVLPVPVVLATMLAVLLVALLSCAASLRRVAITPLGVARRVGQRGLRLARVLPLAVLVLAFLVAPRVGLGGMALMVMMLALLGGAFAVFNLVGPLLVGLVGRLLARTTSRPATLLAARRLIDDPKSSWRSVGGIALVTFVAGCLSIFPGLQTRQRSGDQSHLLADIGTGAIVTLAIAALMAAVSTGVTQAARVLDQAPQYRALHLGGVDLTVLHAARARETWIPLLVTMGGAAVTSLVLILPFMALLAAAAVRGVGVFLLSAAGGAALVLLASRASRPLVATVAVVTPQV